MAKWPKAQEWVPIHVRKWLMGSTRFELTPEERSVWVDFLVLAGLVGGTGEIPKRPIAEISQQLNCTTVLLDRCLIRFIATGKLEAYSDKWVIKNWEEYQADNWKPPKSKKKIPYSDICGNKEPEKSPYSPYIEEKRIEENRINNNSQISELIATFNGIVKKLPKVERVTDKRKAKIRTRLAFQPNIEWWKNVFVKADDIEFPASDDWPNGWRPSFDWLIENDTNPLKVSEGKYNNRPKQTPRYLKGLEKRWKEASEREREGIPGGDEGPGGGLRPESGRGEDRPVGTLPEGRRLPDNSGSS